MISCCLARGAAIRVLFLAILFGIGVSARAWAAEPEDAEGWVKRLQERIARCEDYQYRVQCYERKGSREEQRSFILFVKDARLVRIKVTGGRGKGSEAALDRRGRIRGRKGGLLKPFVETLDSKDRRIRSLRGTPFWDAAAHNVLAGLRERMAQPGCRCTIGPAVDRPEWLLLVLSRPGDDREQYWLEPREGLLMKAEVYEGGHLVHRFVIQDVRMNVGLKESFFSF